MFLLITKLNIKWAVYLVLGIEFIEIMSGNKKVNAGNNVAAVATRIVFYGVRLGFRTRIRRAKVFETSLKTCY